MVYNLGTLEISEIKYYEPSPNKGSVFNKQQECNGQQKC